MSSMPGAAVATTSITPLVASRLATRPRPWVSRYSASAAGRSQRQTADIVADQLGQRRLAVELDDEHAKSSIGCCSGQNCGYRGLSDAALASHDDNMGVGQELQRIHALRRHLCAG